MVASTTMSSSAAVDLALLGLLAERARPLEELIEAVKRMGGGRFTPTAAFVEGRAAHLIETGCIERRDLVGADCRRESVATLVDAGRRRASALEMAQWAGGGGPVIERCLALEQEREALELRWLQEVTAAQRRGEGIGATLA